ncbi:MAG: beta-ketoacyl-[acyl-carrier-protein] synthase family protein [Thermoanaerobaculia bacterium]
MNDRPGVVVTGWGAVSAWGWGAAPLGRALFGGDTAIAPFTRFDHAGYETHVAGEAPDPPDGSEPAAWRRLSWAERFALAAGREAAAQARLPERLGDARAGVFFGSSTGGMLEAEEFYKRWRGRCLERAPRAPLVAHRVSAPADAVARSLGVTGPVETVSSACASGTLALGLAQRALADGRVDVALTGGADSLCRITFGGFNALRSVAAEPCRPFRADRTGLSLGEGAAVLVLEREETARARGARVLGRLLGAGAAADSHHMTAPHPEGRGAALAVERALTAAGVERERVDFINAHGTGTDLNDVAEYRGLHAVFGERVGTIPLTSTKGSVGHLLGSAGSIEAVATLIALAEQRLQPTPGDGEVDPEAPVRLVRRAEPASIGVALSLSLGFGGCNAAAVLAPGDRA